MSDILQELCARFWCFRGYQRTTETVSDVGAQDVLVVLSSGLKVSSLCFSCPTRSTLGVHQATGALIDLSAPYPPDEPPLPQALLTQRVGIIQSGLGQWWSPDLKAYQFAQGSQP